MATLTHNVKVTVIVDGEDDIRELEGLIREGDLSFSLNIDPITEKTCPVCGTKFFPELRGKRNQKYDKAECRFKAYRQRKKLKENNSLHNT